MKAKILRPDTSLVELEGTPSEVAAVIKEVTAAYAPPVSIPTPFFFGDPPWHPSAPPVWRYSTNEMPPATTTTTVMSRGKK